MKENQEKLRNFKLQLFAEPPADGDDKSEKPPVISQADLDKAIAEATKLKLANDKLSHENAEYKKSQKQKLSVEEQLKLAAAEKEKEILELKQSLNNEKIGKSLAKYNFDDEQSKAFLDSLNSEDPVERANGVLQLIDTKVQEAVTKAKEEFTTSSLLPGSDKKGGKEKTEVDEIFDFARNFK